MAAIRGDAGAGRTAPSADEVQSHGPSKREKSAWQRRVEGLLPIAGCQNGTNSKWCPMRSQAAGSAAVNEGFPMSAADERVARWRGFS